MNTPLCKDYRNFMFKYTNEALSYGNFEFTNGQSVVEETPTCVFVVVLFCQTLLLHTYVHIHCCIQGP